MSGERLNEWLRRETFSSGVRLAWGSEYWDLNPEHYDGASGVRDRFRALRRPRTRRGLALELTDFLLSDVILAAGGVERSVDRLRRSAEELEQLAERWQIRGPKMGLADNASIDAVYAFTELLSWVRAVDERLDRRPWKVKHRQGLLPALRPKRLTKRVEECVTRFRAGPAGSCRDLANLSLHSALVRNPASGVEVTDSGAVRLPIPDAPGRNVHHWYELTWADRRDGFAFAEEVWQEVQRMVDDLLTAFEKAIPKRLRTTSA